MGPSVRAYVRTPLFVIMLLAMLLNMLLAMMLAMLLALLFAMLLGSRRFKKVQEGSGRFKSFKKAIECSRRLIRFKKIPEGSSRFQKV